MKSVIDFHLAVMEFLPGLYWVGWGMWSAVNHCPEARSIFCDAPRDGSSLLIKFPCFSSVNSLLQPEGDVFKQKQGLDDWSWSFSNELNYTSDTFLLFQAEVPYTQQPVGNNTEEVTESQLMSVIAFPFPLSVKDFRAIDWDF